MYSPDLLILRHAWREYSADVPKDESSRRTLTSAWREHVWIIEGAWRGLMQRSISPVAWNFLSELLDRRRFLRQVYLEEGGWLLTKRGTRRKRYFKGQRKPRVDFLREEIKRAQKLFSQCVSSADLSRLDTMILASSGVIWHGKNGSRRKTVRRFRDTWERLSWLKPMVYGLRSMEKSGLLYRPGRKRRLR